MIDIGPYRLDLLSDGTFEDDADSFVQPEPEAVPHAKVRVKAHGRIKVGFNCLVIRGEGRTIVVDPGTGDKPRPDKVAAYSMQWPRRFYAELEKLGVGRADVDTVILTHLHWDHAGGATLLDQGEEAPAFPRAQYYVQKRELEGARAEILAGDRSSYLPEDFEPLLKSGQLRALDGAETILPGISVEWVGGHCAGLQVVKIIGSGASAVYLSDLVPTSAQLDLKSSLSYDQDVTQLKESKARVLADAEAAGSLLIFVHAPRVRAGYLRRDDGRLKLEAVSI